MVRLVEARRRLGAAEREDRVRMGHFDEGEEALLEAVARGRYIRLGLASLRLPVYRSARAGRPHADGHTEMPIHIAVSFIAKRHGVAGPDGAGLTTHEAAARRGRVYLHPGRGELAVVRAAGAHRDRRLGDWGVPEAQFRAQPELHRFASTAAQGARLLRRTGRGKARSGAAAAFQLYIEGATVDDTGRMARLLHDEDGPLSLGTLGDTPAERAAFWQAVVEREPADGRVQSRAIVELPHELTPAELRPLVRALLEPLAKRGLPHHAAVHRPDVEEGSDPRNVHLHILWSERPATRTGAFDWRFAARKDRDAQGPAWVRTFRARTVVAINAALDRAEAVRGVRIARRYHPGGYRDLGVEKLPGLHLGPSRTALERAGVPTAAATANGEREHLWIRVVTAERALAQGRRLFELMLRPGVPDAVAERLAAAVEAVPTEPPAPDPAARAPPAPGAGERTPPSSRRAGWPHGGPARPPPRRSAPRARPPTQHPRRTHASTHSRFRRAPSSPVGARAPAARAAAPRAPPSGARGGRRNTARWCAPAAAAPPRQPPERTPASRGCARRHRR